MDTTARPNGVRYSEVPLYFIENLETQWYLFQDGDKIRGKRGSEGGAQSAPSAVGADANYYNRAYWMLEKIPY